MRKKSKRYGPSFKTLENSILLRRLRIWGSGFNIKTQESYSFSTEGSQELALTLKLCCMVHFFFKRIFTVGHPQSSVSQCLVYKSFVLTAFQSQHCTNRRRICINRYQKHQVW